MKKNFLRSALFVMLAFLMQSIGAATPPIKVTFLKSDSTSGGAFNRISSNGRYLIGSNADVSTFLYDRLTGKLNMIKGPEFTNEDGFPDNACFGQGVSNEGIVVGTFKDPATLVNGVPATIPGIYKEGAWSALERIEGSKLVGNGFDGGACIISGDGKLIGGYLTSAKEIFKYNAVTWSMDGNIKTLLEGCDQDSGGRIISMSDNGSLLGGWVKDSQNGLAAIWASDKIIVDGERATTWHVSPNGKYAVGFRADPKYKEGLPFIWNATDGFKALPVAEGATGGAAFGVSNDGTVVGVSMLGSMTVRTPFIIKNGVFYDLVEYLKSNYNWELPENLTSLFSASGISADGNTIYGFADDGQRLPWLIEFENFEPSKTVFAYRAPNSEGEQAGLYSFDTASPSKLQLEYKGSDEDMIVSGAYGAGEYYIIKEIYGMRGNTYELLKLNLRTGVTTKVAATSERLQDMAYDYSTHTMFAVSYSKQGAYSLVKLNLTNGTTTKIADFSEVKCSGLACSYQGQLYSVDAEGNFYKVNKEDGTTVLIGATGASLSEFISPSLEFDHSNETLYYIYTDEPYDTYFATINLETGASSLIDQFANKALLCALYVPFNAVEMSSPAAVAELKATAGAQGALTASLQWMNPTTTFGGNPLDALTKVEVMKGDAVVGVIETPALGSEGTWTDHTAVNGLNTYQVYAVSAAGKGQVSSVEVFVGKDVPGDVSNLVLVKSGSKGILSWNAPTQGLNGGWFDASTLKYKITRIPDNKVVAEALATTTFEDEPTAFALYAYTIEAYNANGKGSSVQSEPLRIGLPLPLPYVCDFSTMDMASSWSNINVNGDNATWGLSGDLSGSFAQYMYVDSQVDANDWLISPALKLEAQTVYRLTLSIRSKGAEYPERLKVCLGKDQTVAAMTQTLATYPSIVNRTFEVKNVDFTTVEAGAYSIGLHCYSAAEMWSLDVTKILVAKKSGASLDENAIHAISVYPNPVAEKLYIDGEYASVSIYNALGAVVLSDSQSQGFVDVSALANGVYFVNVVSGERVVTCKVMIRK